MISDHGGNLDLAIKIYGGRRDDWIDLSTGINPNPYPFRNININELKDLPNNDDIQKLILISKSYLSTNGAVSLIPGAQAAINILPILFKNTNISILEPTYNEYKNVFFNICRDVKSVYNLEDLAGSEVAILCNPNNPTGKIYSKKELIKISKSVDILIIDESFIDLFPNNSLCNQVNSKTENILILRSFGKFFGLAGLRLGFTITGEKLNEKIQKLMGPWPVSNAAIAIGSEALLDSSWINNTIIKLKEDSYFLERLSSKIGWVDIGGTYLFKLFKTCDAKIIQHKLAKQKVWSRRFSYSKEWIRLGIPNNKHFLKLEKIFNILS